MVKFKKILGTALVILIYFGCFMIGWHYNPWHDRTHTYYIIFEGRNESNPARSVKTYWIYNSRLDLNKKKDLQEFIDWIEASNTKLNSDDPEKVILLDWKELKD